MASEGAVSNKRPRFDWWVRSEQAEKGDKTTEQDTRQGAGVLHFQTRSLSLARGRLKLSPRDVQKSSIQRSLSPEQCFWKLKLVVGGRGG